MQGEMSKPKEVQEEIESWTLLSMESGKLTDDLREKQRPIQVKQLDVNQSDFEFKIS